MLLTDGSIAKKGDRVVLTNPSKGYSIGPSNPLVDTEWECKGTISGSSSVRWDNECSNGYADFELSRADGCISIWSEQWP